MSTEREKALIRELLAMAEENLRKSQAAAESAETLKKAKTTTRTKAGEALIESEAVKMERMSRELFEQGQEISNRVQRILGDDDNE